VPFQHFYLNFFIKKGKKMKNIGNNLEVVGLEDGTACDTPDLITEQ